MRDLRAAGPVAVLMSRGTLRQPIVYVTLIAVPASYVLLLFLVSGPALGRNAILGAVVAAGTNAGIVSLPQILLGYRLRRLQDMFVASEVTPHAYLLGAAISRLVYVSPIIAVAVLSFVLAGGVTAWGALGLVALIAVSWVTGSVLGFVVAARLQDPASVAAACNMLGVLLVMLPPVYYPVELLPELLSFAVLVLPTVEVAVLARALTGQVEAGSPHVWPALAALAAWILVAGTYGWRRLRWRI